MTTARGRQRSRLCVVGVHVERWRWHEPAVHPFLHGTLLHTHRAHPSRVLLCGGVAGASVASQGGVASSNPTAPYPNPLRLKIVERWNCSQEETLGQRRTDGAKIVFYPVSVALNAMRV
jgi:hypothetical protein